MKHLLIAGLCASTILTMAHTAFALGNCGALSITYSPSTIVLKNYVTTDGGLLADDRVSGAMYMKQGTFTGIGIELTFFIVLNRVTCDLLACPEAVGQQTVAITQRHCFMESGEISVRVISSEILGRMHWLQWKVTEGDFTDNKVGRVKFTVVFDID